MDYNANFSKSDLMDCELMNEVTHLNVEYLVDVCSNKKGRPN